MFGNLSFIQREGRDHGFKLGEFGDKTLLSRFFLMKGMDNRRGAVTACGQPSLMLQMLRHNHYATMSHDMREA